MSVNKVILIGNVGKDPQVRYIAENKPYASFPLATSDPAYTTEAGAYGMAQHRDVGQERRICGKVYPQGHETLHRGQTQHPRVGGPQHDKALCDGNPRRKIRISRTAASAITPRQNIDRASAPAHPAGVEARAFMLAEMRAKGE